MSRFSTPPKASGIISPGSIKEERTEKRKERSLLKDTGASHKTVAPPNTRALDLSNFSASILGDVPSHLSCEDDYLLLPSPSAGCFNVEYPHSTSASHESISFSEDEEYFTPLPGDILVLDDEATRINNKGKERASPEDEDDSYSMVDESSDETCLTTAEKEELALADRELAMRMMVEDLMEIGMTEFQAQMVIIEGLQTTPASPVSASSPGLFLETEAALPLTVREIAEEIVESVRHRPLPPAYGTSYVPEPSSSRDASPLLLARSLILSREGSNGSGSVMGLEEGGGEEELFEEIEAVLLEEWEINRERILRDIERESTRRASQVRQETRTPLASLWNWVSNRGKPARPADAL